MSGIGNSARNDALTEMAMGFARSRVLCAAARLGVADAFDEGRPTAAEALAERCGADAQALYRLLRALASIGIVAETAPGEFVLTEFGAPLRKDSADSEWASVVFWSDLLADNWSHLTECVRSGENAMRIMEREGIASRWSKDPDARAIFGAVMGTRSAEDYMPIARAWDFSKHRAAADLGGGGGALISAALHANPGLRGVLADHPEFLEATERRLESEGLGGRCEVLAADLRESAPTGCDVYLLKHVLHGYDDQTAVKILSNCRAVLPDGGRVLVIEFVLPDVVAGIDADLEKRLMSDLNMLAVTGGRERSATEWKDLIGRAGLEYLRIVPVPGDLCSIVEAGRGE